MFGWLFVNHAESPQRILIKFAIQTKYGLTWEIGYILSHGNTEEPLAEASIIIN